MKRLLLSALLVMLCVVASLVFVAGSRTPASRLPSNIEHELRKHRSGQTPVILYHGGPVMISGKSLYVIYYGAFTATQHSILDTFLQNLGGSGAFNVNSEYYDAQNMFIQNILNYSPATDSYNDNYSLGTKLSGSFASTLVANAISSGHLPADTNGIYILTISPGRKRPEEHLVRLPYSLDQYRQRHGYQVRRCTGPATLPIQWMFGQCGQLRRYN